jgi:hypothetical protein
VRAMTLASSRSRPSGTSVSSGSGGVAHADMSCPTSRARGTTADGPGFGADDQEGG